MYFHHQLILGSLGGTRELWELGNREKERKKQAGTEFHSSIHYFLKSSVEKPTALYLSRVKLC